MVRFKLCAAAGPRTQEIAMRHTLFAVLCSSITFANSSLIAGPGGGGCPLCAGDKQAASDQTLDQRVVDTLVAMREEEKLARDVYLTLGDTWDASVFEIAESERRHLNAMKGLLDRFGVEDPIKDDTRGVFTSERYAKLYKELITRGSKSRIEALRVGAFIEELDLTDLREASALTQDESINRVLNNLRRATRNHLRAFARAIEAEGATYKASHLSQEEFDAIASSPHERGGQGQGKKQGRDDI